MLADLGGSGSAAHGGNAAVVAVGNSYNVSSCARRRVASFCCLPIGCPRALTRLLPSAVRVRIRSRSTLAKPPSTASKYRAEQCCSAFRLEPSQAALCSPPVSSPPLAGLLGLVAAAHPCRRIEPAGCTSTK